MLLTLNLFPERSDYLPCVMRKEGNGSTREWRSSLTLNWLARKAICILGRCPREGGWRGRWGTLPLPTLITNTIAMGIKSYCHQKLLPSKPPSPMPFPRPININIDLYMHRVNLIVPHATCINCVALLVTKSNLRCVLIIALCQLISSTSILHALCNLQRITSPASPHSLTHYLLGMGNL